MRTAAVNCLDRIRERLDRASQAGSLLRCADSPRSPDGGSLLRAASGTPVSTRDLLQPVNEAEPATGARKDSSDA
ncbi:MAG TPA: hypothetical protein VKT77_15510, partial [Chthonomonadaceae bacterium]|nr:hypothetical protein [Chthonomonadaceae bacterium]